MASLKGMFLTGLVVLAIIPCHAQAATVQLPETGQTTSYAAGDDGSLREGVTWPVPRFFNNGNGTMTDMLTGLTWLKDANCAKTIGFDPDKKGDGSMLWSRAIDFVAGINIGNYGVCSAGLQDWRLPNINELESLVNAEVPSPAAWLTAQGFSNVYVTSFGNYWSSTSHPIWSGNAWVVSMIIGDVDYSGMELNTSSVWPVRGSTSPPAQVWKTGQTDMARSGDDGDLEQGVAWPLQRFVIIRCDANGPCADQSSDCDNNVSTDVVYDALTGLVWTRDADLPKGKKIWEDALTYANGRNLCGVASGWHLPNRKEMRSLVQFGERNDIWFYDIGFQNTKGTQEDYYWTSTTYGPSTAYAWYWRDLDGQTHFSPLGQGDKKSSAYVWPVNGSCIGSAQTLIPAGQGFLSYPPTVSPAACPEYAFARPLGVGPLASNGSVLNISVRLAPFSRPVDIYLFVYAQHIDPQNIYVITPGAVHPVSSVLEPWKQNLSQAVNESITGDVSVSALPKGKYDLLIAVTPAGTLTSYYVWMTSFVVP